MNIQSESPLAPPKQPKRLNPLLARAAIRRSRGNASTLCLAVLGTALWLMTGAVSLAVADATGDCTAHKGSHAEPGAVFETIEDAALDALAHAHHTTTTRDVGRLRVGTIQRVAGGFSYTPAQRSGGTVWASRGPVLRYALGPKDVASYVIHPKSGVARIDRANERPNESQRRMVDEHDSRGRPLYVLTPSLRVVRYANRATTRIADLSDEEPHFESGRRLIVARR